MRSTARVLLLTPAAALTVAAAPPVVPGNRAAFCRGEVSAMYGVRPIYVKTGKLLKDRRGATSVSGTVDKGSEGVRKFKCRFDTRGRFIDVMAMTPDGY